MKKLTGCFQPSLEFLRDLAMIADQCVDNDANGIEFKLGPLDNVTMNVSIRFDFKVEDK